MDNKNKKNQNIIANQNNKGQNVYRNNSDLTNKNSYMIYELNNTFNDKDKKVTDINKPNEE